MEDPEAPSARWGAADHRVLRGGCISKKILTHLAAKCAAVEASRLPPCRALHQRELFD
jgi:hypothetical protein